MKNKTGLLPPFQLCSALLFLSISFLNKDHLTGFEFALFFLGFSLGGPAHLIGSAIACELAKRAEKMYKGSNENFLSTITSILESTGLLFGALSQIAMPYVKEKIFLFFMSCSLVSCLILFFAQWEEHKLHRADSDSTIDKEPEGSKEKGVEGDKAPEHIPVESPKKRKLQSDELTITPGAPEDDGFDERSRISIEQDQPILEEGLSAFCYHTTIKKHNLLKVIGNKLSYRSKDVFGFNLLSTVD
eukprot:TRINITY_DN13859_c0_g2_i1.p1 TRINITY_DN13859_c0_g2~~TRINITY_DN13859_c0_g2_i1.p1  ORF type:complete len:245 (-),score=38.72 TRINITY_DN13859_c0_g2_i1:193-927(-)